MKAGWTWNWNAKYHIKEHGKTKIIEDKSVLRGFKEDELKLFLKINKFDTLRVIKQESAITTVAKKI